MLQFLVDLQASIRTAFSGSIDAFAASRDWAALLAMLPLGILFGTFMWMNLTFAGAWQLALGFAMLGELGAIYFTVFDRRPLIAGFFFAMAFGNRTECLLTAPILMYFHYSERLIDVTGAQPSRLPNRNLDAPTGKRDARATVRLAYFCLAPFLLGVATLAYNYVRFHSITDFGYARIPGVLDEVLGRSSEDRAASAGTAGELAGIPLDRDL